MSDVILLHIYVHTDRYYLPLWEMYKRNECVPLPLPQKLLYTFYLNLHNLPYRFHLLTEVMQ